MIFETPLNALISQKKRILREIEWYSVPNRKGTNYSDAYRAERIAILKAYLEQYETAIQHLEAHKNER